MAGSVVRKKKAAEQPKYVCPYCERQKHKEDFYTTSDILIKTGVTSMCKDCAEKLARKFDEKTQTYGECDRTSAQNVLERLDKPFLEEAWDMAFKLCTNGRTKKGQASNLWLAYMRIISNSKYKFMRWHDGDVFTAYRENAEKIAAEQNRQVFKNLDMPEIAKNQAINDEYKKNRQDVIRLIGYDPFEAEAESDKPLLYSQLIGYLDAEGESNEDMMRISSAISIVRGFSQQAKIDDMISDYMKDPIKAANNVGTIKSLQDMKQKNNSTIINLAAESCLSLKNNKVKGKGDNTWTGKIKKLKDLNLREAEVNGFDLATCKGMQQVMDLSNKSILRTLSMDESEYADIIARQRELVTKLTGERDGYQEISRILLRENLDLKQVLKDNELLNEDNLTDLNDLFSPFKDQDEDIVEENDVVDEEEHKEESDDSE